MSVRLNEQKPFLSLLLTTEKRQKQALLKSITNAQTDLLGEIFFNLVSTLPLTKSEESVLKRKPFIARIASLKSSPSRRKKILTRHHRQVINILDRFAAKLLGLIQ